MNVVYVAHFRESGGWSKAAIDCVLCLDRAGVNLKCVDIKLTNKTANVPARIIELEQNNLDNFDIVIQHVLPHHFVRYEGKKNVLYLAFETGSVKNSGWNDNLKLADEIWVPNNELKEALITDGFKQVKFIPHTFDLKTYENDYAIINIPPLNSSFKFYTILDLNDRKNLDSIIRCFHSEFNQGENVSLIIKASKYGVDSQNLHRILSEKEQEIRTRLRIHKDINMYNPVVFITERFPEQGMLSIHRTCHCFLNLSHGEGWSIPAFEAMCFGNTPICSNQGGPKEFIDPEDTNTGSLIDGIYNVCYHSDPAFPKLFTGKELWFVPSEQEAKERMRFYYENRNETDKNAGLKQAEKFNYENVGKLIISNLQE